MPIVHKYAAVINEIRWEDRLKVSCMLGGFRGTSTHLLLIHTQVFPHHHTPHKQHNHHAPHFPYRFTTMWDSYPIKCCVPEDAAIAGMLHQPKYKMCVFKVTIGVTFTGEIVALVTLSLGISHDGRIAEEEEGISFPYRYVWEWSIGDGPYEVFKRCLVPHRPQLEPGSNSRYG